MTREPVYDAGGALTGYRVTHPAHFITVRDDRGYDSIICVRATRVEFEPIARQRGMFDDEE
ncbi:hypothetical protein [Burkholderia gladioli]|uniref:hypothetical protein n=1 Tax=Burkholderia gladioli TaxID=28095 RepID=UPI00163FFDB0|nr:hypothetical protein [Burkholderia gladioli]